MGTDTPTNLPFCRAGPVSGTKLPRRTPMTMANKIQTAKKRSSQPSDLKAEVLFDAGGVSVVSCFSTSSELVARVSPCGAMPESNTTGSAGAASLVDPVDIARVVSRLLLLMTSLRLGRT